MTAAVRLALTDVTFDAVGNAQAELAVALARLVDGGSVPAARELRTVLLDLSLVEDAELSTFLAAVRTPGIRDR